MTATAPIQPDAADTSLWHAANRRLLAKALGELSWEEAIHPEQIADDDYRLLLPDGVEYRFSAWRNIWQQLVPDPSTLYRLPEIIANPEAAQFFIDAQETLGITPATLCNLLEELSNTLMADLRVLKNYQHLQAADMVTLPDDELQCLLDGHPKVTVSKGRMGWGISDYQNYATEYRPDIQLEWLAVKRTACRLSIKDALSEEQLLNAVLDADEQQRLLQTCDTLKVSTDDYLLVPVHPWQWHNKLVNQFAGEIATGRIRYLGPFGDPMLPQQSLRTLSNRRRPSALNIKLPLTILNTSCYRGIPGRYIMAGPALSAWLADIARQDPILAERRCIVLEEPAGMIYPHPHHEQVPDGPYRFHEMLGCIWRESVHSHTDQDEAAVLIATLFQKDGYGQPLINEYINHSGMSTEAWLDRLFDRVVIPLYHLLCKYGVGLVAHGQNVTLVLKNNRPERVALKDFQGDLRLIDQPWPELDTLPAFVQESTTRLPAHYLIHDLQTGHFVTVLRFISTILAESGFPETAFYRILGRCLQRYMASQPELAPRFDALDLFKPTMARICLNRVRFKTGYDDSAERPLPALASDIPNPLVLSCKE